MSSFINDSQYHIPPKLEVPDTMRLAVLRELQDWGGWG